MGVRSYCKPAVAAIFLFASEMAISQDLNAESLRKKLIETRSRVLRSSGTMQVTTEQHNLIVESSMAAPSPPPGVRRFVSGQPSSVAITTTWAFRGRQTYEARGEQWQQLFDGSRWLGRSTIGDQSRGWIGMSPRYGSLSVTHPIKVGYRISGLLNKSTTIGDIWLCDLFRFVEPSIRTTADMRIEISWNDENSEMTKSTTAVLNPAKGYLIEEYRCLTDRMLVFGDPNQFGKSESLVKVLASSKVGEIWLPTSIKISNRKPSGEYRLSSVIRVDQIENGVEQSRFDRFFQTGDLVREDSQFFVAQSDGTLKPTTDPGGYSRRGSSFANQYMTWVAGIGGAIVLAFAAFKGFAFLRAKRA